MIRDWMFTSMGLTAMLAGLLLAGWAIWFDRPRGRRRCPKCWYDLRGTPGMRCSECGFQARRERQLHKTHRRWRTAFFGTFLVALGFSGYLTPQVRATGWLSIVPTEVLLRLAPPVRSEMIWTGSGWVEDRIVTELSRRDAACNMSARQWGYVIANKGIVETRKRWPVCTPIFATLHVPSWAYSCVLAVRPYLATGDEASAGTLAPESCGNALDARVYREANQSLGLAESPCRSLEFSFAVKCTNKRSFIQLLMSKPLGTQQPVITRSDSGVTSMPIQVTDSIDEAISPVRSGKLDVDVRNAVHVCAGNYDGFRQNGNISISMDRSKHPELDEVALGFLVELLRNGELLESKRVTMGYKTKPFALMYSSQPQSELAADAEFHHWPTSGDSWNAWSIRIRGDGRAALADWHRDKYWAGEFTVPLVDIAR